MREGDGLARDEFPGGERAHQELLQSAHLALAHDGERSEKKAEEQHDQPHHRGDVVVAAGEVGVEPCAAAQLQRCGARGHELRAVRLHDARGVAHGHRGQVRVRAVEDELHRGIAAGEIARVAGRDLDPEHRPAVIEGGGEVLRARRAADDLEVTGGGERVHERRATRGSDRRPRRRWPCRGHRWRPRSRRRRVGGWGPRSPAATAGDRDGSG